MVTVVVLTVGLVAGAAEEVGAEDVGAVEVGAVEAGAVEVGVAPPENRDWWKSVQVSR
ncbi:hypothetical protein [Mycolicibacterium sp.]|uniref:hypothetical protein n=1 Tax=Mycolicibacterium sp. TaxID=2320850 RepID=UPI0025EBC039|nr:hypothetical protein [Mycolicibacterium sp.]